MKYFVLGSLVLLVGCGLSGTAPNSTLPTASTETAKFMLLRGRVIFIGDQITVNMFTPAFKQQHPNWTNAGVAGETTAQALAAFQAQCIAPHPQVCHIMIGLNDVLAWVTPGTEDNPTPALEEDIVQMIREARAANIAVVVATEFPSFLDFTDLDDFIPPVDQLAGLINFWMTLPPGYTPAPGSTVPFPANIVVADYWTPLTGGCGMLGGYCNYLPGFSSDDITPNAAGYSAMYPVLTAAIQKAQVAAAATKALTP
jgi:lysophospholipase L1-like esterase